MNKYENEIIMVLGHRGSGKSTWLTKNLNSFKPFLLVDPLNDPRFIPLNLYRIETKEEAEKIIVVGNPYRLVASPPVLTTDNTVFVFDYLIGLCLVKGGITVVIDEIDSYTHANFTSKNMFQLLNYGRHRQCNIVMVARRLKAINPTLRGQVTRYIIFPMSGEDILQMRDIVNTDTIDKIQKLKAQRGVWTEYIDFNFHSRNSEIKTLNYSLDTTSEE